MWSPACGPPPNWLRQSAEHLGVGRLCPGVGGEGKLSCFVVGGGGWGWSGTGLWSPACGPPPNGLRQSAEHLSVGLVVASVQPPSNLAPSISRAFGCWPIGANTHINKPLFGKGGRRETRRETDFKFKNFIAAKMTWEVFSKNQLNSIQQSKRKKYTTMSPSVFYSLG